MENYDLRSSFTPDLHGLHVKIYQFRELLRLDLPALSGHLDDLQVDPAYVSQWFLSFFAVTCPLPMLFRIYDVIFAEGAIETIMRVALSLMRKNQGRILACTEMEDVLQLLLSRGLWDCYHYNADEFVHDFVSLSSVVTRERLAALEQGYRESQLTTPPANTSANAARASAVSTAASRFLGRLWANSTTSLKASPNTTSANLTPGAASRPMSMLRRTASKQSLASTLNSMEAGSSTSTSSASSVLTEATTISRDSAADDSAIPGKLAVQNNNSDSKNLHSQIEDLLVALSDLQRQHAQLADQLQKEREEREEDRAAVRTLLSGLRKKASNETLTTAHSADSEDTIKPHDGADHSHGEKLTGEGLSELLDNLEDRFGNDPNKRRSSITQTKTQMRDDVTRAKEHLRIEMTRTQDANRRVLDLEEEIKTMKEQLRESHAHVRNLHTDKQRLEKQIHSMRVRASDSTGNDGGNSWLSRTPSTKSTNAGLREFKLNRSKSTPSQISINKRTSSLLMIDPKEPMPPPPTSAPTSMPTPAPQQPPPADDNEALLLELVQAKTAQAVAKQEAEEAKQKLEQLRKQMGLPPGDQPLQAQPPSGSVMGMFRSFSSPAAEAPVAAEKTAAPMAATPAPAAAPAANSGGGGFWGWGRK